MCKILNTLRLVMEYDVMYSVQKPSALSMTYPLAILASGYCDCEHNPSMSSNTFPWDTSNGHGWAHKYIIPQSSAPQGASWYQKMPVKLTWRRGIGNYAVVICNYYLKSKMLTTQRYSLPTWLSAITGISNVWKLIQVILATWLHICFNNVVIVH